MAVGRPWEAAARALWALLIKASGWAGGSEAQHDFCPAFTPSPLPQGAHFLLSFLPRPQLGPSIPHLNDYNSTPITNFPKIQILALKSASQKLAVLPREVTKPRAQPVSLGSGALVLGLTFVSPVALSSKGPP